MNIKRPIMRYHGGKFKLAEWIISHFPEHRGYVEPFGGGGSVLIAKIYIHRVAVNFGMAVIRPWDGKFYFEKIDMKNLP